MNQLQLPKVLTESFNFGDVLQEDLVSCEQRLRYILEIADNIDSWLSGNGDWLSLGDFLDDLELDISVNQNITNNEKEGLTNWLMHTNWLSEIDIQKFKQSLNKEVLVEIEKDVPSINAKESLINLWLKRQCIMLRTVVKGVVDAKSVEQGIGNLFLVNILLAKILFTLYKFHLTRNP